VRASGDKRAGFWNARSLSSVLSVAMQLRQVSKRTCYGVSNRDAEKGERAREQGRQ
jgi:hypothetical protein